ncbi:hypothetical protein PG993_009265 [Apiospora rasikravindrae]|uniref:Uncharacterized protein n=1 Tax=Apiospora rasikravindrae TaxID=990691 RepID=A0ABR1SIW4_9PEZI
MFYPALNNPGQDGDLGNFSGKQSSRLLELFGIVHAYLDDLRVDVVETVEDLVHLLFCIPRIFHGSVVSNIRLVLVDVLLFGRGRLISGSSVVVGFFCTVCIADPFLCRRPLFIFLYL